MPIVDHLCGLVVRLTGCRPGGSGFDSQRCQFFSVAMGLERGPLSPCEDKCGGWVGFKFGLGELGTRTLLR
jgi:hypothetical protein